MCEIFAGTVRARCRHCAVTGLWYAVRCGRGLEICGAGRVRGTRIGCGTGVDQHPQPLGGCWSKFATRAEL